MALFVCFELSQQFCYQACMYTERRQRVVVEAVFSNWKSILSGVPQGSVLGPVLLLIYISDLVDNITSNALKFADDTHMFRKVNNDGDKQHLQNDIDKLVKWSGNGRCYSILGKVNSYTHDTEPLM